jgi:hypothetical protein
MMFKSSIYDRLQQVRPVEPEAPVVKVRSDYRTDTLCLLDGVALTSAGAVAKGQLPSSAAAEISATLRGPDGYGLLVHEIALGQAGASPASGEQVARLDRRHQRLETLIQALIIDALLMLEALPEGAPFDIVLSAPIRHASLVEGFIARLRETVAATPFADALGSVSHRAAAEQDLHQLLAAEASGGMPHVILLSVDSLLFDSSVSELSRRGQLAYASRPSGLFPGEAVAALLFERLAPDSPAPLQGWQVPLAATLTHAARGSRELRRSPAPLMQLIERQWPVQAENDEHASTREPFEPMRLVIDSLGLPGRAVEAGTSLMNRWPGLDMIEDGTTLDSFCGWPGDAWLALALVLAIAELEDNDSALVVSLRNDTQTQVLALTPFAG